MVFWVLRVEEPRLYVQYQPLMVKLLAWAKADIQIALEKNVDCVKQSVPKNKLTFFEGRGKWTLKNRNQFLSKRNFMFVPNVVTMTVSTLHFYE